MKNLGEGKSSIRIYFEYFNFRQLVSGYINFPCIRSIIFMHYENNLEMKAQNLILIPMCN